MEDTKSWRGREGLVHRSKRAERGGLSLKNEREREARL